MDLQTLIYRSESALSSPIEDELVMFDSQAGKYYGLNEVAASIWNHLSEAMTVAALGDRLAAEYDITPDQCRAELLAFLPRMQERGLIEVGK